MWRDSDSRESQILPPPPSGRPQDLQREDVEGSQNASTSTSDSISALWCELLEVPSVEPQTDFFALGGHSLLAMQMMSLIRRTLDVRVPVRILYENSRFDAFCERVAELLASP